MRLAHCSDLHLLSHDGAGIKALANKRWIGAANLLSNRSRHYQVAAFDDMIADINALGIEHVLCTGDVTNLALPQEFAFSREKFDHLALGPLGVTVIPGNHDAYVDEGVHLFHEAFGPFHTPDAGWEWPGQDTDRPAPDDDLHWPLVRVRGDLALIGLSTSRQTPWFTAYGVLGAGQLARLEQVLADPRLAGKVRVVAIHHPPAGKRAESVIRGLKDRAEFAAVIGRAGAELIVHGHEHRDMTEVLQGPHGPVTVRGVASGTYFHGKRERQARYRIFEIANGAITGNRTRIWDPETHVFADGPAADAGTEVKSA